MKRKVIQRVLLLVAFFYGGMHLTLIGLAAKLKTPTLNYTATGLGIVLMLVAFGYFAFKCIVQYKSLTEKKKEESES